LARAFSTTNSTHKEEKAMAKGQMKSNKETKKPKADKNVPKKGAAAAAENAQAKGGFNPFAKKA
jgi:hypothetical protein